MKIPTSKPPERGFWLDTSSEPYKLKYFDLTEIDSVEVDIDLSLMENENIMTDDGK